VLFAPVPQAVAQRAAADRGDAVADAEGTAAGSADDVVASDDDATDDVAAGGVPCRPQAGRPTAIVAVSAARRAPRLMLY